MDATVSPWSDLQRLFRRWHATAASAQLPREYAAGLIAFFRKRTFLTIALGAAAAAAFGAYCMYRLLASDIPAVRAEFQKAAVESLDFRFEVNASDARQRSDLQAHVVQEKALRDALTSGFHALNVRVIALTQKAERRELRPQEVKDLLSSVRDLSIAEAAKLESVVMIGGVLSESYTPLLALAKKDDGLTELAAFFNTMTPSVRPAYVGRLLLTKNGVWRPADREILFKWDGGSAKFRTMKDLNDAEIVRKVELFNSVSQAVSQAVVVPAPEAAPRPAVAPKFPVAPRAGNVQRSEPARARPASMDARRPQAPPRREVPPRPEPTLRRAPTPAP